jgi:hypothetical protein
MHELIAHDAAQLDAALKILQAVITSITTVLVTRWLAKVPALPATTPPEPPAKPRKPRRHRRRSR